MKSLLTIEKEYLKKEYQKSPLGLVEKELNKVYDQLYLTNNKPTKEIIDSINKIREDNEKRVQEYVENRLKLDREAVDNFLLESMTEELGILTSYHKEILKNNGK